MKIAPLRILAMNKCLTRQHGQSMVEYLVITVVVSLVMFIPHSLTNNQAPADYLARAVRAFFRSFSFLVSVL